MGVMPMPRQAANCPLSVSMVTPECSMSNRTNSAPAVLAICGMPGVKNSNTIVPKAKLPARKADLTGLLFIHIPHDAHSLHGGQCRAKFIYDRDLQRCRKPHTCSISAFSAT